MRIFLCGDGLCRGRHRRRCPTRALHSPAGMFRLGFQAFAAGRAREVNSVVPFGKRLRQDGRGSDRELRRNSRHRHHRLACRAPNPVAAGCFRTRHRLLTSGTTYGKGIHDCILGKATRWGFTSLFGRWGHLWGKGLRTQQRLQLLDFRIQIDPFSRLLGHFSPKQLDELTIHLLQAVADLVAGKLATGRQGPAALPVGRRAKESTPGRTSDTSRACLAGRTRPPGIAERGR